MLIITYYNSTIRSFTWLKQIIVIYQAVATNLHIFPTSYNSCWMNISIFAYRNIPSITCHINDLISPKVYSPFPK